MTPQPPLLPTGEPDMSAFRPAVRNYVEHCVHGVMAMRNGDHWVHVVTLSRCVPPDAGASMHLVVRDGSVWFCRRCRRTWPYPAPVPRGDGPCCPEVEP